MITRQYPVHEFLHTYLGATLIAIGTVLLFFAARLIAKRIWLPNLLKWQELTLKQVAIGATLGAYSHVFFDSIMHQDMMPLSPFNESNILLSIISLGALHWLCIASAVLAVVIIGVRKLVLGSMA